MSAAPTEPSELPVQRLRSPTPPEIHVWHASVDALAPFRRNVEALLCPAERSRAAAFHFSRDRDSFVTARVLLRRLLEAYTGVAADALHIDFGLYGKPFLKYRELRNDPGSSFQGPFQDVSMVPLEFNVSHSGDHIVLAFSSSVPVGVDVEVERPGVDPAEIVQRFFSPREVAQWREFPTDLQTGGFYRLWTRKEAFVKALGRGLSLPLDSFAVEFDPRTDCRLVHSAPGEVPASQWSLIDLTARLFPPGGSQSPRAFAALAAPVAPATVVFRVATPELFCN